MEKDGGGLELIWISTQQCNCRKNYICDFAYTKKVIDFGKL